MPESIDALEDAIPRLEALGDSLHAGSALRLLGHLRWGLGEPESVTRPLFDRALTLLEETPGPELVSLMGSRASSALIKGAYAEAIEIADQALALAAELGLPEDGKALLTRGDARCALGDLGALEDTERAFELFVAAGQGRSAAVVLQNDACTRWFMEGPTAAVERLDEARAFSEDRGLTEMVQVHAASSSVFLIDAGRIDEGLARAAWILPLLRASEERLFEHDVLAGQAVALDERGEDALAPAERALEIARGTGDAAYLAFAAWGVVPALITAGRVDEAHALLRDVADNSGHDHSEYCHHLPRLARAAVALNDDELIVNLANGVPHVLPRQQHAHVVVRAIQAERAGEFAEAAALYADAADRWEKFTEKIEQAHALLGEGRCLAALGDPHADAPLRRARALFDEMGARRRVDECDSLIADASKLSS